MRLRPRLAGALVLLALAGCGEVARLPLAAGIGPTPTLPAPQATLIPTVHIAPATGWPPGVVPQAAPGTRVTPFASGLENHPVGRHGRLVGVAGADQAMHAAQGPMPLQPPFVIGEALDIEPERIEFTRFHRASVRPAAATMRA